MWIIFCAALVIGASFPAMAYTVKVENTTTKSAAVNFQYVALEKIGLVAYLECNVTIQPLSSFTFRPDIFLGQSYSLSTFIVTIDGNTLFKFADGSEAAFPACIAGWSITSEWKIKKVGTVYSLECV